eukprot:106974-Hanusia_phi.AAC.2
MITRRVATARQPARVPSTVSDVTRAGLTGDSDICPSSSEPEACTQRGPAGSGEQNRRCPIRSVTRSMNWQLSDSLIYGNCETDRFAESFRTSPHDCPRITCP